MMLIYRICHRSHAIASAALGRRKPGRWHKVNQPTLYFASSLSLAVLELRANGATFEQIREECHYGCVKLETGPGRLEKVPEHFYAKEWTQAQNESQEFGSDWFQGRRSLFLEVKSAVLPVESNYLLNPEHPGFKNLDLAGPTPVPLDPRV
jgi:RES domain-containing protein